MQTQYIKLIETNYGSGFKGTLLDLMRDVYKKGQESKELDFDATEYFNMEFTVIQVEG